MIAISTALVIGIIILSGSIKLWWLLLLWICLMPFSLWLGSCFQPKNWKYYLSHLGVVRLIVGAISSSELSSQVTTISNTIDNNVIVAGMEIPISQLSENDILIKTLTLPISDIIPYVTKPLIILFWLGGFIIIAQPLIIIISERTKNRKNK